MKKKTFIVQLLDSKNPSRKSFTQVEDANFYSNDTDASLVFIPHEDTFEFQSAKVVMYNRGDESLVERDAVVTTENGRKVASYELPAEIISHWGDWTAQPVFTSGGEIYSGSIVPFSVIRYLMHERPPSLTEVVSVTEFIQQSQALVDDMEQAEAQRASAETTRASAETQRVSNETVRVSAEKQRVTDHANRSAELDGKADKVVIGNLIQNGNFSQGLTGFTPISPTRDKLEKTEKGLKVTSLVDANDLGFFVPNLNLTQGNTHYIYISHDSNNPRLQTADNMRFQSISNSIQAVQLIYSGTLSSATFNTTSDFSYSYFSAGVRGSNPNQIKPGDTFTINHLGVIDLTQTFGAGNEPTKEEMDELIKVTGYIDGEYALNNKEMLGHLMKGIRDKANKKQEDWITPTLLNGAVAEYIRYRKNEFGVIDIQGNITSQLSGWITLFKLPIGYRPQKITRFAVPTDQYSQILTGFVDHTGNVGVRLDSRTSNYINVSIS